eukprot:CAMPEP_0113531864 /NCGR_PEP_ID=MMETSP0015_2-20120614/3733_1 /TAXON_ID=2838 /ORGANISM="Odontella" /LENGTH=588 /DNA_ID=CAMNT_0000430747 /DNA_START=1333 /DNA_END=3099 /DNA_ORIENTATION=+ /assembly_acc=CAM_ASM_000160
MVETEEYESSEFRRWKLDYHTLSVRSKYIETECVKVRSAVLPGASVACHPQSRSQSSRSKLLEDVADQLRWRYSTTLRLLRSHVYTAISALRSIRSGHAQTISAGKEECRTAVEAYESQLADIIESTSISRDEFEREAVVMERGISGVVGKMERWETSANVAGRDNNSGVARRQSNGLHHPIRNLGVVSGISPTLPRNKLPAGSAAEVGLDDGEIREAVAKIDAAICASGGKTGGWDEEEHRSFVRLWTRHCSQGRKRIGGLAEMCHGETILLGRSDSDIVDYSMWYEIYLERVEKKKALIAQWKESCSQARAGTKGAGGGSGNEDRGVELYKENRAPNGKSRIGGSAEAVNKKRMDRDTHERLKTKEAIEKWREDRQRNNWDEERAREEREEEGRRIEKEDEFIYLCSLNFIELLFLSTNPPGPTAFLFASNLQKKMVIDARLKKRLADWKTAEEERKAQAAAASAKLSQTHPRLTRAELERRRQSDIDRAKALSQVKKRARGDLGQARQNRIARLASSVCTIGDGLAGMKRDSGRLVRATSSSSRRGLSAEELEDRHEAAKKVGAHEGRVPLAARDLTSGVGLRRA